MRQAFVTMNLGSYYVPCEKINSKCTIDLTLKCKVNTDRGKWTRESL